MAKKFLFHNAPGEPARWAGTAPDAAAQPPKPTKAKHGKLRARADAAMKGLDLSTKKATA